MGAILERPLYGRITLETAAWASTFTWVDRTADLVRGIDYSIGGRVGVPGQSQVDVGTLNATFRNLATVPVVGDLVRLRLTANTDPFFVGYVQDVSQRIVFENSVSLQTPVVLTTINCLDWVGYVSQFQVQGAGGLSTGFVFQNAYPYQSRARALNYSIDPTNATQLIAFDTTPDTTLLGDTDLVGTIADHLDLTAFSANLFWFPTLNLPSNKTTGRTSLIQIRPLSLAPSSGYTFTDEAGSAGQLHYTEIDLESSSQNIANTIVINNSSLITNFTPEITRIGGGNRPNFSIVNDREVVNVPFNSVWASTDASSITTYGNRASEITANLGDSAYFSNLVSNPSMEYSDAGWATGGNRMARRKPLENGVSFSAYDGEWSLRYRLSSGGSTASFRFSGSENDGIAAVAGNGYFFQAAGLRGLNTSNNTRVRAFIEWQNSSGAVISTSFGTRITVTNLYQWYVPFIGAFAPANTERAVVGLEFDRASGSFSAGDQLWLDGALFNNNIQVAAIPYFDGDTASTTSDLYLWTGEVGNSPSLKIDNKLDDLATTYLSRYSSTSNRVTRIRWNAQEDLTKVSLLRVGRTVSIIYDGTTTQHRIVGVDGNISPDRYMIDYYLEKV